MVDAGIVDALAATVVETNLTAAAVGAAHVGIGIGWCRLKYEDDVDGSSRLHVHVLRRRMRRWCAIGCEAIESDGQLSSLNSGDVAKPDLAASNRGADVECPRIDLGAGNGKRRRRYLSSGGYIQQSSVQCHIDAE